MYMYMYMYMYVYIYICIYTYIYIYTYTYILHTRTHHWTWLSMYVLYVHIQTWVMYLYTVRHVCGVAMPTAGKAGVRRKRKSPSPNVSGNSPRTRDVSREAPRVMTDAIVFWLDQKNTDV